MAYTKTTWNNLSDPPINAENLNKIEQGIYNNSLGIDKINPSGTATTTAEIEEGQISDVIGFKSLKPKGQTSQYTTTGKNKLSLTIENKTAGGITLTKNNDNSYKISGTSTSLLLFNSSNTQTLTANTTYTLGLTNGNNDVQLSLRASDGNTQYVKTEGTATSATFTPTTDIEVKLFVRIPSGVTVNETIFPIVVEGSTIGTYEPYTGGKASPNPDFPQDVNNVSGDNVIGISNKNVLPNPIQSQTLNGVTVTRNSDGTLLINGTATANTYFDFSTDFDTTKYAGYKFYGFPNNPGFRIRISNSDRVSIQEIETNGTVIANNGTGKYIAIRIASGANVNNRLLSPMLIAPSETDTTYIEHQGNDFELNFTKNLFDSEKYLENASISNNTIVSTNNNNLFYIPVQYGRNYTFSFVDNGVSGNILYGFSNDKPVIGGACTYNILDITQLNKHTFTPVSTNNKYLCIRLNVVNTNQYLAMENIQVEVGNQATEYIAYNKNPIELCKIGTYQDYIYKKDGKWWKHKEIESYTFDGSESWTRSGNTSSTNFVGVLTSTNLTNKVQAKSISGQTPYLSDYFIPTNNLSTTIGMLMYNPSNNIYGAFGLSLDINDVADLTAFQSWLSNNNVTLYYVLATPIDEEITYAPLLRQLDELYNSGLYDNTNISQDNSSEAFILDLEACKNNINGIVEYIRR